MTVVNEIDPRLKKLAIILKDSLMQSENKTNSEVLNLWSAHTLKESLEDPFFYERPITQPPLLTQDQYLDSLKSKNVPQKIIDIITLVNVDYRGFDNQIYHGQIIVHKDLVPSTIKIFKRILNETDFPITSIFPISMFNWHSSSKCNNSATFDWRFVFNSDEISDHAFGAAIDINPLINPWKNEGSINDPRMREISIKANYDQNKRGALHANSDVVKIFKEEGWKWGGDWKNSKDWPHFYRPDIPLKYFDKVEVPE